MSNWLSVCFKCKCNLGGNIAIFICIRMQLEELKEGWDSIFLPVLYQNCTLQSSCKHWINSLSLLGEIILNCGFQNHSFSVNQCSNLYPYLWSDVPLLHSTMFRNGFLVAVPLVFGFITSNATLRQGSTTVFNIPNSSVISRMDAIVLHTLLPNVIGGSHTQIQKQSFKVLQVIC